MKMKMWNIFYLDAPNTKIFVLKIFQIIAQSDTEFIHLNFYEKLRYLLALKCSENSSETCCKFIREIYRQRETDNCTSS